jgi:hypothetical protein
VNLEAPECCGFDNARPSVTSLFNDIRAEARDWVDAGARDIRQLLP